MASYSDHLPAHTPMPMLCWFLFGLSFCRCVLGVYMFYVIFSEILPHDFHILSYVFFVYGTHMVVRICMHMCGGKPEAGIGTFLYQSSLVI